ncbi:MAG: hypothetical protein Q8M83_03910 [bacterium]|nr:hypothetical protein [bacterium]
MIKLKIKKILEIIFNGFFLALLVGLLLLWFEKRDLSRNSEAKIIGIDEYNYGVACLIKNTYLKDHKNLLVKYDTNIYKDNFDFLGSKNRETQIQIKQNITYMETSNKMMDVLLEKDVFFNTPNSSSLEEIKNKLMSNADLILQNIHKYDRALDLIKCEDALWFSQ